MKSIVLCSIKWRRISLRAGAMKASFAEQYIAGESQLAKNPVGVEKVGAGKNLFPGSRYGKDLVCWWRGVGLRSGGQDGLWSLVEEANESLNILRCRCQPELLWNEFQSPQAQAAQVRSDSSVLRTTLPLSFFVVVPGQTRAC
jgi:hypothetical protein